MLRSLLIASVFAFVGSAWADCGEDHAKDAQNDNQNPTVKMACEGSGCEDKATLDDKRICEGGNCNDKTIHANADRSGNEPVVENVWQVAAIKRGPAPNPK